ncbi:MAG: hypothetical protein HZA93_07295 [Verrucomicrobia bacterium]|nr:hypothetical protein [Verrucomicrobiota bacterium]
MLVPPWRHGSRVRRPFCAAAGVSPRSVSRRAQRALTDSGADAPARRGEVHRDRLLRGEHAALQAEWAARVEPPEVPDEAAPARGLHRYLANRPEQLDYPSAVAAGLPVGSGLIESGHRHVLQARLKRAAAWWTDANRHAMVQLRVCRANAAWAAAWPN